MHGSAWTAATGALLDALEERPGLASWRVNREEPDKEGLKAPNGEFRAIWPDPDGTSEYEVTSLNRPGYRESCSLTLLFAHKDEESTATQSEVDLVVNEAIGEVLDVITTDPRLGGRTRPSGWDISVITMAGINRAGGRLDLEPGGKPGRDRWAALTLTVTAFRC